jgi:hypothetical protein
MVNVGFVAAPCCGANRLRLQRNFEVERIIMPLADDGAGGDGVIGAGIYNPIAGGDQEEAPHLSGEEQVDFLTLDGAAETARDVSATSE